MEHFSGKPEGKRSVARPRHGKEDNIKTDLKEIRCEVVDWIQVVQDTAQWQLLVNLRIP
jgi:hypothetical protein